MTNTKKRETTVTVLLLILLGILVVGILYLNGRNVAFIEENQSQLETNAN